MGKKLTLGAMILYTVIACICAKFLNIHPIHVLNTLLLSCILHNLLEWKYSYVEEENNA